MDLTEMMVERVERRAVAVATEIRSAISRLSTALKQREHALLERSALNMRENSQKTIAY